MLNRPTNRRIDGYVDNYLEDVTVVETFHLLVRVTSDGIDGTQIDNLLYARLITKDNSCQPQAIKLWIMGYSMESSMRLQFG